MSINVLWLTNGKKTVYLTRNTVDGSRSIYERLDDMPCPDRHCAENQLKYSRGPFYCEPETARIYGVQDIFYPDWPKPCRNPDYQGRNCTAEACKYGGPGGGWEKCPYFAEGDPRIFEPIEIPEKLKETFSAARKMGRPGDLIRREDAVNAIRTACIRKHIPFNSSSPEGRRALEAIWAVHTTPAAIHAAELEGVKNYTRLRELLKADREGRCFVLMVQPHPYQEKADAIICEDGEAYLWRVLEATIGQGGNGEINVVYETEGPGFQTADIGVTVFLPDETEKIEAALKKMQEENHG